MSLVGPAGAFLLLQAVRHVWVRRRRVAGKAESDSLA